MIRSGECSRCGECCKGDPFNGERGEPVVEGYCPLFRWSDDGKALCTGYGEDPYYLRACVFFPQEPIQISDKPSCTYVFID